MGVVVGQYNVFLIDLDPTKGRELKKTRPCLVLSPNEMNNHIGTVIIAPMTTQSHSYPSRTDARFDSKNGWIVLDQIRTVDKTRLVKKLGSITADDAGKVKAMIREMLVD